MGLHDFTFYDVVNRNAVCFRGKNAWFETGDSRSLTFDAYKKQVDSLAGGLQALGLRKGDRIGILAKNSLEHFMLFGAGAAVGSIMLPINWRLSLEEIHYNLNDGTPKVLFVDPEFHETVENLKHKLSSVEEFVSLGPEKNGFKGFETLLKSKGPGDLPDVASEDGFVIIHTAAVSGHPRGALLSHGNVLCANMNFMFVLNLMPKEVHLNTLPFFHVGGLFATIASFHAGALTLNMREFDGEEAVKFIEQKGVSFMVEFPPILSTILDVQEKSGTDLTSFRAAVGLDGLETIERYQRVTGGIFYVFYGQTETSCLATFGSFNDRPGSAGRVLPLAEVGLVDDYDRPVEVGEVGEITVKGPMVFQGYWNLPGDNAYASRGGWHHTGDLGRIDEDGFLWYAGRKVEKDLIKPGGENVYPAEVEKMILQHPSVLKTVVFGVPDPKWGEGIKAVCVLKEGETLEEKELIEFVGARIARYKKPRYVEFVAELPLLKDGSPDRQKSKEMYGGNMGPT